MNGRYKMKELYERTELTVTEFLQEDVIITSGPVDITPDNGDTGNDNPMPIKTIKL